MERKGQAEREPHGGRCLVPFIGGVFVTGTSSHWPLTSREPCSLRPGGTGHAARHARPASRGEMSVDRFPA